MKKIPRILLTESIRDRGTQVLNVETEQEVIIPYGDHWTSPHDERYAGMGPGYWYRVYRALKALGWDIKPEDFGYTIAIMIHHVLIPFPEDYPDTPEGYQAAYDEWDRLKAEKTKELVEICE